MKADQYVTTIWVVYKMPSTCPKSPDISWFWIFGFFKKKSKQAILFRNFLGEKFVIRKNRVHHGEECEKTKKIAVSDFSFSKLCHRDFCETCGTLLAFFKKVKTSDFVWQFSPWKMRRPKKRSTPRRSARKMQDNSSLRFFIFETLSQRFLRNIFIDFQFFEKIKNDEFAVTRSN